MATDKIHLAIDLKEAAAMKDPFGEHLVAPDKESMIEIERETENVFSSEKPEHEKIDKLLTMQSNLGRAAHVKCTPEDEMWRDEMNDAVRQMDQTA